MKVSVILPTYNESGNIIKLIHEIVRNIPSECNREIIVVDDNSPDGTFGLVKINFENDNSVIPILRLGERGLANSIKVGVQKASGDYILVMDTDFTHDPAEIPRMLHVVKICDMVSGSRFCAGGLMDDTRHYIASFTYNLLIRLVIHTQIQDNLGGFWVAKAELIKALPFDNIFFGYGDYYFRLLHFAQKNGMRIIELPCHYITRNAGRSKSNFMKLLFNYSKEVFKLSIRLSKINNKD